MRRSVGIVLYTLLCLIWGSTWLVIKIGYGGLGPFNVAALRFYLAAATFAVIVPLVGARWPSTRADWLLVATVGILLFAAQYGLIYWAEQFIDSGVTAILFATLPLMTVLMAHRFVPGEELTPRKLAGTVIAFGGVAALFAGRIRLDTATAGPMLAVIGAAAVASVSTTVSKRGSHRLHPAALNAPAMLLGAIVLTAMSMFEGGGMALPQDRDTWLAIGYLAIAGSVITFLIYFSLLKTWSVTSLSFITVFTPAVALFLGFLVRGERLDGLAAIGALLILSGVVLAVSRAK